MRLALVKGGIMVDHRARDQLAALRRLSSHPLGVRQLAAQQNTLGDPSRRLRLGRHLALRCRAALRRRLKRRELQRLRGGAAPRRRLGERRVDPQPQRRLRFAHPRTRLRLRRSTALCRARLRLAPCRLGLR